LSATPEDLDRGIIDQFAKCKGRLLGIPAAEVARLAALPLPETSDWQ
jgi:hypothetical protein